MYEAFGFGDLPNGGGKGFSLFIPDNTVDPKQYGRGGPSKVTGVKVVGTFQQVIDPVAGKNWDEPGGLVMTRNAHPNGVLFTAALPAGFPDGYYQYKYVVTFRNGSARWVGDPCAKHGGDSEDNAAFVLGGNPVKVTPLEPAKRTRVREVIAYELMIDDFTKEFRNGRAAVDAVVDKLDEIKAMGFNAIEFMPWIAWPDSDAFSWGYDPISYFSVENDYTHDPNGPLDKLARLGRMISECHKRGLMVILDVVLQHASAGLGTRGFAYNWLWQDAADCPFVGNFTNAETFGSLPLDYHNACTLQFIVDACVYWIERFRVDGFRFDQVSGFNNPDFPKQGAPAVVAGLKKYLKKKGINEFPLILEDTFDFNVMADTNHIGATNGWFDMFRARAFNALAFNNRLGTDYVRVLNCARDFDSPIGPTIYIENHDHSTLALRAGGRGQWFRTQPYAIALATCSGNVLVRNGQEFAQAEYLVEPGEAEPPNRVQSRPLRWGESTDGIGTALKGIYTRLLHLRRAHPSLCSPNFYPNDYDEWWAHFSPEGYGIDVDKQVVIYHRWGDGADGVLERFIVVLNFSGATQFVDIPFPTNGEWTDLINGDAKFQVGNFRMRNFGVNSNWGCVFFRKG